METATADEPWRFRAGIASSSGVSSLSATTDAPKVHAGRQTRPHTSRAISNSTANFASRVWRAPPSGPLGARGNRPGRPGTGADWPSYLGAGNSVAKNGCFGGMSPETAGGFPLVSNCALTTIRRSRILATDVGKRKFGFLISLRLTALA